MAGQVLERYNQPKLWGRCRILWVVRKRAPSIFTAARADRVPFEEMFVSLDQIFPRNSSRRARLQSR
jgi:hypothetical protein